MTAYAHAEVLVETDWLAERLDDPAVRVIEGDSTPVAYQSGHIPGAIFWNPYTDLLLPDRRVNPDQAAFETLLSRSGITNETTAVVYSSNPVMAPWLFWFLKLFGHAEARVLNGGRAKWLAEGRPLTTELPTFPPTRYTAQPPNPDLCARRDRVQEAIGRTDRVLVDVRGLQEYRGELFGSQPPQSGERGGHIPGAVHFPYEQVLQGDGTFKPAAELAALFTSAAVTSDQEAITYCAIGGRAAHTWFVLKYLLGYPQVRNYDGSWYEWGRLPDTPIAS